MKLNQSKCAFGIYLGKFLGFIVLDRGIEENMEKIRAIMEMEYPHTINEVQKLTGHTTTLNRFVSKAITKCLPFFYVLKNTHAWNEECNKAFIGLK